MDSSAAASWMACWRCSTSLAGQHQRNADAHERSAAAAVPDEQSVCGGAGEGVGGSRSREMTRPRFATRTGSCMAGTRNERELNLGMEFLREADWTQYARVLLDLK